MPQESGKDIADKKREIAEYLRGIIRDELGGSDLVVEKVLYASGTRGFSIGGFDVKLLHPNEVNLTDVMEKLDHFEFDFEGVSFETTGVDLMSDEVGNDPILLLVGCRERRANKRT